MADSAPTRSMKTGIDLLATCSNHTAASAATPSYRTTRRAEPKSAARSTPPHIEAIVVGVDSQPAAHKARAPSTAAAPLLGASTRPKPHQHRPLPRR